LIAISEYLQKFLRQVSKGLGKIKTPGLNCLSNLILLGTILPKMQCGPRFVRIERRFDSGPSGNLCFQR